MNRYDLQGRVAIVTGGASGIGLATAKLLLESGATVMLWDLDAGQLQQAAQQLASCGHVAADRVDVSRVAEVEAAAKRAEEKFGPIHILVNSAGVSGAIAPCDEYPLDDWDRQLAINLSGVFYCCRSVIPAMRRAGYGRIVNVASIAGMEGNPFKAGYVAAKAGVIGLSKSLGKELAGQGIIVNCVTPTVVNTPMHQRTIASMPPEMLKQRRASIPIGRVGEPEEAAAMIAWLCSADCSYTTGTVFDLSGGRAVY